MFTLLNKTSAARKTGGFTLVELLVVIVVIGLLAAIAVPIFLSQSDKANTASAESDAANIAKLIQADYAETGTVSAMNGSTYTSANGFGSVTAAGTVTLSGDATTWCVESTVDGQVASFSAENGAGTGCAPAAPALGALLLDWTYNPSAHPGGSDPLIYTQNEFPWVLLNQASGSIGPNDPVTVALDAGAGATIIGTWESDGATFTATVVGAGPLSGSVAISFVDAVDLSRDLARISAVQVYAAP